MNEFYNKLKYFEETEKIPKEVYYHYTSLDALYSIVKSHTFYLMSLRSSNDRTELYYKPETFISDITKLYEVEEHTSTKKFYGLMKKSWEEHEDSITKELKARKQPYALCLSDKKDNLTHWDRYAYKCQGVAIGFNVRAFDILYRRTDSSGFALGLFDFGQALYTQEDINKAIRRAMIKSAEGLSQMNKKFGESIEETISKSGYLFMGSIYSNIMKFAKTNAFVDEDEFRIYFDSKNISSTLSLIDSGKGQINDELYKNIRKNFVDLVDTLELGKENFAITRSGIRGYHKLCLDKIWGSGVVPEIVLGPMCVQNKNELQRFLKCNGLEGTKITISSVPIR